jgi:hypothetical protein
MQAESGGWHDRGERFEDFRPAMERKTPSRWWFFIFFLREVFISKHRNEKPKDTEEGNGNTSAPSNEGSHATSEALSATTESLDTESITAKAHILTSIWHGFLRLPRQAAYYTWYKWKRSDSTPSSERGSETTDYDSETTETSYTRSSDSSPSVVNDAPYVMSGAIKESTRAKISHKTNDMVSSAQSWGWKKIFAQRRAKEKEDPETGSSIRSIHDD